MKFLPVIGRILFSVPLLVFGFAHLGNAQMMVDNEMVPSFLPMPLIVVYLTGVLIILCGGAIAVGFKTKPAALVIGLFLMSTSLLVWAPKMASAGPEELEFMGFFMRDMGLAGAAFFIAHFGAGQ